MNKKTELAHLLSERDIHIALIQESQHYKEDPHITNYTHTGCSHGKNECQGLLTYIRNDVTGTVEELSKSQILIKLREMNKSQSLG